MAATVTADVFTTCSAASTLRRRTSMLPSPRRGAIGVTNVIRQKSSDRCLIVLASKPQREELNSNIIEPDLAFPSQDDLNYLFKLGGGSVLGAAAVKYGSILFPEITRPNILQALVMIFSPVVISVFLLIRKSSVE